MASEQKQLLLKDLCGRLPYHPPVKIYNDSWEGCKIGEFDNNLYYHHVEAFVCDRIEIKPYLRPMSSMTEEELRDFAKIKFENDTLWEIVEFPKKSGFKGFINVKCKNKNNGDTWTFQVNTRTPLETYYGIDWLDKNMFDYRGLIPMGLALEAKEGIHD